MNDNSLFAIQAELCRAMASATRIEIIHILRDGPQRVGDIARAAGHPQSTISRHFAVLRNAGIVTSRRRGPETLYQIANPKIVHICDLMREVLAEEAAHLSQTVRGRQDEPHR